MRKKHTRKAAPKVTAAVKELPVSPTLAEKNAAFKIIEPDMMQAMDMAAAVGERAGKMRGFAEGVRAPRTHGELRAKQQLPVVGFLLSEVFKEIRSAVTKHGPMHSGHEAYAVIKEELDEYWDEIKADRSKQASARAELVQIAAMAVRALLDTNPR